MAGMAVGQNGLPNAGIALHGLGAWGGFRPNPKSILVQKRLIMSWN
jgi:hypothetical protein